MNDELRKVLAERIDAVSPAPGDLDGVRSAGRRIRTRRRVATGALAAAAVVVVGGAIVAVDGDDGPGRRKGTDDTEVAATLDFSGGVRAYADPGGEFVSLGGQRLPARDLQWLDTDAAATSYGVVYYLRGAPTLFDETGTSVPLTTDPVDDAPDFHPTVKADAGAPVVAWATRRAGSVTLTVHDLAAGEDLASTPVDCGPCRGLVIDAVDGGVVFVRTADGTRTWDILTGEWRDFAGPATRVADVRNGVVLYDGPRPTEPGDWTPVAGSIDAQLTFDGGHVLDWSSTLAPVAPGGEPIVLDAGPANGRGYGQWTIDSDGSVLVFAESEGRVALFDCAVPSGSCERLEYFSSDNGDPMFIGNDM